MIRICLNRCILQCYYRNDKIILGSFKKDIHRYKTYANKSAIVVLITQQGLWALCVYRWANAMHRSSLPKLLKKLFLIIAVFQQKWIEIITGISIPYTASIGDGLYIGHFGQIIINANAVIGDNCNISQGCTIGVSGAGEHRGVPKIGDNVYIGANATVVGKIEIASGTVIGANSLVHRTVEKKCTMLGVPATIVSTKDSSNYI